MNAASGRECYSKRGDNRLQLRQPACHNRPYRFKVYAKIVMHQNVPHPGYLIPFDIAMFALEIIGKPLG